MERLQELREEFGKLEHTRLALLEVGKAVDFEEASVGSAGSVLLDEPSFAAAAPARRD